MLAALKKPLLEEAWKLNKRFFGKSLTAFAIVDRTRGNSRADNKQPSKISFQLTTSRFGDALTVGCEQLSLGERDFGDLWQKKIRIKSDMNLCDMSHLIAIQIFHAEVKFTKATVTSQQEPSIISKEDSDFEFHMRLLASTTHNVTRDVNWMFGL